MYHSIKIIHGREMYHTTIVMQEYLVYRINIVCQWKKYQFGVS